MRFRRSSRTTRRPNSVRLRLYKMGVTYEALKQVDLARKAFETVIQKYPAAYEAILAKQRLGCVEQESERQGLGAQRRSRKGLTDYDGSRLRAQRAILASRIAPKP